MSYIYLGIMGEICSNGINYMEINNGIKHSQCTNARNVQHCILKCVHNTITL